MSYIEQFFGNPALELTYHDIQNFFQVEQVESDIIEFKSFVSNGGDEERQFDPLFRTLCGFLNSSGGLLIWGAPRERIETRDNKKIKIYQGELVPVDRYVEKDRFISKAISLITPSPNSILFYRLSDGNNYVYLFEAGQSEYRPHQYKDIYRMRVDGQTIAAPHHYVEALFKRITYPKLKGFVKILGMHKVESRFYLDIGIFIFNTSRLQNVKNVSYTVLIGSGAKFIGQTYGYQKYSHDGQVLQEENKMGVMFYDTPIMLTEKLELSRSDLRSRGDSFFIRLNFGSEASPMLISSYNVKPNFTVWYSESNDEFVVDKFENKFSFELNDANGLSEEDRIEKLILGFSQLK